MRGVVEHGAKLIRQLVAVTRPQAIEPRVFALNDAVNGIRDLLNRLSGENIAFSTFLAEDAGSIRMDSAQIQQVLLNLVLNARDAMPNGGQMTLTTRNCTAYLSSGGERKLKLTPCVELAVTDTGFGMDGLCL
jgi:two-component system, cell cycle sensor histidine kinase and response regulator CckA